MLPFFRKIRYRLAKDNQFFKYSRYAIGEIVLVVVGILIALYINDWNKHRKDGIKKMVYKKALIEDLRKDTAQLIGQIRFTAEAIKFHQGFVKKIEKRDVTFDTIFRLYTSHDHGQMGLKQPNKTTFESLLSTGDIELFSDKEIEAMMLFYSKIELNYFLIGDRYGYAYEILKELTEKYGFLWKVNKDNLVYETLTKDMNQKDFVRLFDLSEYRFLDAVSLSNRRSEQLLKDTNNLLSMLAEEVIDSN
jgi:hypothetical protein